MTQHDSRNFLWRYPDNLNEPTTESTMRVLPLLSAIAAACLAAASAYSAEPPQVASVSAQTSHDRVITRSELRDKIAGAWLGQMTGVYFGLPFELLYFKDPVPFDVNRFYNTRNKENTKFFGTVQTSAPRCSRGLARSIRLAVQGDSSLGELVIPITRVGYA